MNRPGHRPGLRSGRRPGLFSHLHALRKLVPCLPPKLTHEATARLPRLEPALPADARPLQSTAPAFMRVSLNTGINQEAAKRAPVRVYHSASRLIMVGTFDAVCRMIDHCIEEERVAMQHAAALK
ncbi:hypothetical protein [Paraburkholderia bonniea]|uniref:hypothetical protein n=1 Tax=Paraburkholderia bonniea TaxID=2152891 RepID=UPI003CCCCC44